jgi:hypothetical protein
MNRSTWNVAALCLATMGCHKTQDTAPDAKAPITAADVDLQGTVNFVKDARAKNAAELEGKLNGPDGPRVDIDHDGKRDTLRVVEKKAGKKRTLEIRAIPSAQPTIDPLIVAYVDLQPDADGKDVDVVARWAEIVVDPPPPITVVVLPVEGTFVYAIIVIDAPVIEYHLEHHKHHKWH